MFAFIIVIFLFFIWLKFLDIYTLHDNYIKVPNYINIELDVINNKARIVFIDNGSGISLDDLPHIFERFFKTDSSRSQDGTGLGLSICNHIMELHGGKISVESSEGIGSTFTISLQKYLIN